MLTLADLIGAGGRNPALVRPVSPDPGEQAVLDRAAKGDVSALPAVRDLLQEGRWVTALGGVAGMALDALVRQAAGDDLAVAEAVGRKYDDHVRRLLADGGGDPSFAERLAATRAAHNWLGLHVLECLAARAPAGGAPAAALDRRVTQAERRLHLSLRSLAALRRLRGSAVVTQVNVAAGPMVVDNRG